MGGWVVTLEMVKCGVGLSKRRRPSGLPPWISRLHSQRCSLPSVARGGVLCSPGVLLLPGKLTFSVQQRPL